jgi:DNA helicase-2/ATP-dependent DNA helicase PcrA
MRAWPPNEIAVLYRSHFLALEMQLALTRAGVPYTITSGVKFFERQHVRDLIACINFVYNPSNTSAWNRLAMLLPKVGEKGAQKIYAAALDHAKLMQQNFIDALAIDDVTSKVPKDAKADWPNFCASLKQVYDAMNDQKPSDAVEVAIDGWYGDYMKGEYADYVDRIEELKGLVGFASQFTQMSEFLAQIMLLNGETSEKRVEADQDSIKLTTIHQAKGLEYDAVFLIGAAEGQFPGYRTIESGDFEEERRLFYVAVTRAKNELYICYPKSREPPRPGRDDAPTDPLPLRTLRRPLRRAKNQTFIWLVAVGGTLRPDGGARCPNRPSPQTPGLTSPVTSFLFLA